MPPQRTSFDVKPSEHIVEFIHSKITNKYIKKHVVAALNTTVSDDRIIEQVPQTLEEIPEDSLCPTCKSILVFSEGCSICIECGHSGCTSG